jgi:hypothetical protein
MGGSIRDTPSDYRSVVYRPPEINIKLKRKYGMIGLKRPTSKLV